MLDSDRKALSCVEPRTGKVMWRGEFPTRFKIEASPTGADGKIYAIDFLGNVFVVKAGGPSFELVHQTSFGQEGTTADQRRQDLPRQHRHRQRLPLHPRPGPPVLRRQVSR